MTRNGFSPPVAADIAATSTPLGMRCGKPPSIPDARLHDLRHTYATALASAGLSLPIIGALLGHSTPTRRPIHHLFDDPLRAATERASAVITGATPAAIEPIMKGRGRS